MLWLALHFPYLPLQLRQPIDVGAVVVCERRGQRRWVLVANAEAEAVHIQPGMEISAALVRLPTLKVLERQRAAERAALKALCAWGEQFSSRLCMDAERWLLWIEVAGSARYFHGLPALCAQVQASVDALGYHASWAVAPTLEAAALLAMQPQQVSSHTSSHTSAHISTPTSTQSATPSATSKPVSPDPPTHALTRIVSDPASLPAVLANMAIISLPIAETSALETLHALGWHHLAQLWALPSEELARRAGPGLVDYLRRLTGAAPDVRSMWRAPASYQRRFEFTSAVHHSEALWFPLRRLLLELQGYLRGRDTALQTLQLDLLHERTPTTTLTLRTTSPQRDAGLLFNLLREQLDQWPWSQPVSGIQLRVLQHVSPGDTQQDLFDEAKQRDHGWSELMDRLQARLGAQAVRRLGLLDDHRPEQAWCVLNDQTPSTPTSAASISAPQARATQAGLPADHPARPLWLLTPRPLATLPALLGKPERIESGWWSVRDERRDYYLARTAEGSRWWLYRDADTEQWFLHGLWA